MSLTRLARGFFAPKQFAPAPPGAPSAPGSAWIRRRCFRPRPVKIGFLEARLDRFFGIGTEKMFEEAFLRAWLKMP